MQQKWEFVLILVPQVHVGLIVSSKTLLKSVISEISKFKSTKIILLSEISMIYAWNISKFIINFLVTKIQKDSKVFCFTPL